MLEFKNISVWLTIDDRHIIDDFNFTLNPGDKAVIIGEEGNGKSTLLKLVYNEASVLGYCGYSGKIIKKGTLGYLPQSLPEADGDLSLEQYFSGFDAYVNAHTLRQLGLSPLWASSGQPIKTLSGGEKVKVQLAWILMSQPDILILDEPTNDIDIETLAWLEGFINNCKLPVLFVSHDETLIENTANCVIHIEQLVRKTKCRITVARCGYAEYVEHRNLTFEKQGMVARKQRTDHDRQMDKWRQVYNRVDHEQRVITRGNPSGGRLLKKKMHAVKSQGRRLEKQEEDFLEIPQTEQAILTRFSSDIFLPGSKTVLDLFLPELAAAGKALSRNVELKVIGGEHVGIIGKNGAGKTTLLEVIWNALKDRKDIKPYYMPQDYARNLDYSQTVIDYLATKDTKNTKEFITKARTYLGSMKFTHEETTGRIEKLSGGQKAKLLFLEMVLLGANVLILDEPTRNFSPLSNPVIRATLAEFNGAIISVSHDRKYLDEVCDTIYELTGEGLL
ncbi:MAG: ATP-binding cassette domain-containing protein [Clostridiales bacterium]|jgi:ATPase subunit of ABC transporter with duplicated ATPase domains|nr:ATP-binding cassette domain-containing protein [Clostridiales bacterium]